MRPMPILALGIGLVVAVPPGPVAALQPVVGPPLVATGSPDAAGGQRSRLTPVPSRSSADSAAIAALEHIWLQATDTATLARILAPDFVHIAPGGYFLTRRQHLDWVAAHPRPAGVRLRFGRLRVRLYGDVAIATGTVLRRDARGGPVLRTAFTDVFVKRGGRWRAVNAQEDRITAARGAGGVNPGRP